MPTKAHSIRHQTLFLAVAAPIHIVLSNAALAADKDPREEHFYLSDQIVYDDNVFRSADTEIETVPIDPADPNSVTRPVAREDYSNRITLGLGNDFQMGRQALKLRGRVYDVRYNDNDYLDYTGGDASAMFDFRLLTMLSGRLSGA